MISMWPCGSGQATGTFQGKDEAWQQVSCMTVWMLDGLRLTLPSDVLSVNDANLLAWMHKAKAPQGFVLRLAWD